MCPCSSEKSPSTPIHSFFFLPSFHLHVFVYICIGRNQGRASVWTNPADRRMNMPKCDRERGRRCWKTREDKRKTQKRSWTVEKVERDGAPDLTTLTHSGLSLFASCALWSVPREHTRTHIYLSTHAGDEDILGLCACVCVFECDSLSMRAKRERGRYQKFYRLCLFSLQPLCL